MAAPNLVDTVRAHLGQFPPFDALSPQDLGAIVSAVRIRYLEVDEVVFREGEAARDWFYVVRKGCVALNRAPGDLVDLSDEGDIFGIRALLGNRVYSATAAAREDSLVYEVPWPVFGEVMARAPQVALHLAAGFAAELPRMRERMLEATSDLHRAPGGAGAATDSDRVVEPTRAVLTTPPDATVAAAAQAMSARKVGSILVVDAASRPVGIVTDTDLRTQVVARARDPNQTRIADIMSSPVRTVRAPQTVGDLMGALMQSGLRHFCFTEDGTPNSAVVGMASERDLLRAQGGQPSLLMKRIDRCRSPDELARLRDQAEDFVADALERGARMAFLCTVMAGIQDALIRSAVAVAQADLQAAGREPPPGGFCWLSFGSEGRQEQLLRTDLDQAIVYADPAPEAVEATQDYYVALGARATDVLVHAGYQRCPGGIMASNPELTGPLAAWQARFSRWIRTPEPRALMLANIFFDLRPVVGDAALADALVRHVFAEIKEERAFLPFLARSALHNPPPLSFFRGFVVERSGDHADTFDIKARAMMPLADAARVLVYDLGLDPRGDTTAGRFRRVGQAEPGRAQLADEAAMAYEILMRIRTQEGLRNRDSGRYVAIERLNKLERRSLRNTFEVIADVQRMLSSRYRLDYLR
jgi:CBS domain-containing protein